MKTIRVLLGNISMHCMSSYFIIEEECVNGLEK